MELLTQPMKITPELDPDFAPAVLWNKAYQNTVSESKNSETVFLAFKRPDQTVSRYETKILPLCQSTKEMTFFYVERLIKFILWQKGASTIYMTGPTSLTSHLQSLYKENNLREFDYRFFSDHVYLKPLQFITCTKEKLPVEKESSLKLGNNLDGNRIGFDLGGSDRKCAALIDGEVIFSEEIAWSPYFEKDPSYHIAGIQDSLKRAAAHLPQVDAIGGSAAGVYIDNEPRIASLFRGICDEDFAKSIKPLFKVLQQKWDSIPFEVVNDGEVTALAGAMSLKRGSILGISMGTSMAAGYVKPDGSITNWLNELAFAPIDYNPSAATDEWSGDRGCGVNYFSQQAVVRLAAKAGIDLDRSKSFAEQLETVQHLMGNDDTRAKKIFQTLGIYLGYSLAHYADYYDFTTVLLLGRVTSGKGGTVIIENARHILSIEFPELAGNITFTMPDENSKRHGQAIAAASLPIISN